MRMVFHLLSKTLPQVTCGLTRLCKPRWQGPLLRASINALSKPVGESVQKLLSEPARGELPLRVVYGTSFADGCIRVQHCNLQVHVEAKNLIVRKEATMFRTVCTTMTPDTVKSFSGNATGKLLFGVARCDNVLYCF